MSKSTSGQGVARVLGKGRKERLCPLGPVAVQCLRTFVQRFDLEAALNAPLVCTRKGKRMEPRQIQKLLKTHLAAARSAPRHDAPQAAALFRHPYA
jgi:integrase/recombinase XerC